MINADSDTLITVAQFGQASKTNMASSMWSFFHSNGMFLDRKESWDQFPIVSKHVLHVEEEAAAISPMILVPYIPRLPNKLAKRANTESIQVRSLSFKMENRFEKKVNVC